MLTSAPAAARDDLFPAPPFSDPAVVTEMPGDWQARPLARVPADADLSVILDQQIYPALLPFLQDFARREHLRIAVESGTCGIASGALTRKEIDIGGYCCPPERGDRLPGLRFHTIGITAIAVITHPANPVGNLTLDETRKLFGGQISAWRDLTGGDKPRAPFDEPVFVASRLHCKSRPGHWRLLLDNGDLFAPQAQDVGSIPDMVRTTSVFRGAIGYETNWHVALHASKAPVKIATIDGADPRDPEAVATLRYPLYEAMTLTTWEGTAANPVADRLVAFLLSQAGAVGEAYGLVPAERLRRAGWKFNGDELIGEPDIQAPPR